MSIAGFRNLYSGLCELAALPPDGVRQGAHGNSSFSMDVGGVPMTAIHYSARPDMCFLVATMGPLPGDRTLECCRALLDMNLLLQGADPQLFGLDDESGDCTYQSTFALDALNAADFYQRLLHVAALVKRWRNDYFLDGAADPSHDFATMHVAGSLHA